LPEESLNDTASTGELHLSAANSNRVYSSATTPPAPLLTKHEEFKIESLYKSIGSHVLASKCTAKLYTTSLKNLIQLIDWRLEVSGCVPLWVFNTGLNPKRPKSLGLLLVEKRSGFAAWNLGQITYANDFKWSKPGHITFRVMDANDGRSSDPKKSSSKKNQKRTDENLSVDESGSSNSGGSFQFGVLKFEDDFECAKFYDFYRDLFADSHNDDLFNPHYKPSVSGQSTRNKSSSQVMSGSVSSSALCASGAANTGASSVSSSATNMIKCLYKKITKSAISSPVAFNHVNSLPVLGEEDLPVRGGVAVDDAVSHRGDGGGGGAYSVFSAADTQSIASDLTVTSHNTSSLIYMSTLSRIK
jgi:hypothetical protein